MGTPGGMQDYPIRMRFPTAKVVTRIGIVGAGLALEEADGVLRSSEVIVKRREPQFSLFGFVRGGRRDRVKRREP